MKIAEKERLIKSDILSIESRVRHAFNQGYDLGYKDGLQKNIKTLPPVNPQPKIGHWINGDCKGGNCSICGEYYAFYPESGDFNYCPNCGAKMSEIPTGSESEE